MNKMLRVIIIVMVLMELLIPGCIPSQDAEVNNSASDFQPDSPDRQNPTEGTQVGNLAPDFQLNNLEGETVSISDLRGKPVLINFWATWCPPCREEMPYIQEVYEKWSNRGLVLLAINIDEIPSHVREFMQNNNLSFPVLLNVKSDVDQKYNIRGIPATFFIDKDGIIQVVKVGAFSGVDEIENGLSKIMP